MQWVCFSECLMLFRGFAAALVLMFISLVISLIIMPLRGKGFITAGGSDSVEPRRGITVNDWGSDVDHESAGK